MQRFTICRPFDNSPDGCFYVIVPPRCCTFSSRLADLSYTLQVSLKFGFGRTLRHRVPITVRHCLSDVARCAATAVYFSVSKMYVHAHLWL
jgi:hypothetical protein